MNWAAANSYGETEHIACECGAELEVEYEKQDGHNEKEEFNCPECGKEHHVMASMSVKPNQIKVVKT